MSKWNTKPDPAAVKARDRYIRQRFAKGDTKADIARKVGLTPQRVGQIIETAKEKQA
jgi:DNA-binding transcriptional regulator LsrR (DeoR family)